MNNKHPMVYRIAFSVAFLFIFAGLLSTTAVVSADLDEPTTGTITVIKNVVNNNGGNASASDFTISLNDPGNTSFLGEESPGTTTILSTGTSYNVTEVGPTGYSASFIGDCSGTIEDSVDKTCTITNNDVAPQLTLIKDPTNDNSGTSAPDDFNLTIGGSPANSNVAKVLYSNTAYAIDETQLTGYTFDSITGDAKCPASLGGTITMDEGDDITCIITNNDVGFIFTPPGGLLTSESGTSDSFEVALDTKPVADVTLALHSSNTDEGIIDKPSLTFTDTNWSDAQVVTVTGVDDLVPVADGDVGYSIITGPITTSDPDYGSLDPVLDIPDVSVINSDNDTAGISTSPNTDLWTSEGGATETVQVLLQTKPTHPVLLNITSSDLGEGTVSPSSLTINPTPWPPVTPKEFTITGVDDCKSGGDNYEVSITASSDDPVYNGRKKDLNVTNYDAPTIEWVDPVKDEQFYDVEGFGQILLKVKSSCPEPISKVRFYRWVVSIGDNVIIGEDLTFPYTAVLDPADLELGINQVRAFAFGPPVENQTFSIHKRIFIVKEFKNYIFLPSISKNP